MKRFTYLKALFSPLKPFSLKFYLGKIAVGMPYFYPRRWVKSKTKKGYLEAKDITVFGFDSCDLGWKTKWHNTDYRFEWEPRYSVVLFGYQFVIFVTAPHPDHYWPIWLCYERDTDKTKSKVERIKQCKELFPCVWRVTYNGKTETVDYYNTVVKSKYL